VVAILAALEYRDRTGKGQEIDLSMQDIVAWMTEPAWTRTLDTFTPAVLACRNGYVLVRDASGRPSHLESALAERDVEQAITWLAEHGTSAVPILLPEDVIKAKQTVQRGLVAHVRDERGTWPALVPPVRLSNTPGRVATPAPALGRHNAERTWRETEKTRRTASEALAS
jgi:crotonobetainyl-CoA:carnitine CoA-transferase CaiB-like acyl-CoA transferase